MSRPALYVGIDPGSRTGYATWDGEALTVETLTFWDVFDRCIAHDPARTLYVVEDPATISATFSHARGHGSIRREAALLIEGLERRGFVVRRVRPQGKTKKAAFEKITGYRGRTSQHGRDAAMMVYKLKTD